jgi:Uma2 family endonuclease
MVVRTFADLQKRLGDVPLGRIRMDPPPGTATPADVTRLQEKEGVLCELVDGVLVEKAMGYMESVLAIRIARLLGDFVDKHNLGFIAGEAGTLEVLPDLVRIPDVSFLAWDRLPGRKIPREPIPELAPNLAVEVLSDSNTPAEMKRKRLDYFEAGVELVWEIDPETRSVVVWTSVRKSKTLADPQDTLDGGAVLPGFATTLRELFKELDRRG